MRKVNDNSTVGSSGVTSVNGQTGAVSVTKDSLGLSNLDNTSDTNKPVSTAQKTYIDAETTARQAADALLVTKASMGTANNGATLDSTGVLTASQIPSSLLAGLKWQGTINVVTGSVPTAATANNGYFYKNTTAGTSSITGTSLTWSVGDWLISNGTIWQRVVNSFDNATTSTLGVVQLAGDLSGGATSPTVAKINSVTAPASAPLAARKMMMSSSTTALQYDSLVEDDIPVATTSAKGSVKLAQDLGGTALLPKVTGIQSIPVSTNIPIAGQALVYDGTQYSPGTVAGGGVTASYMAVTKSTATSYSLNGTIVFDTTLASSGSDVSVSSGVFTLVAGKTYKLTGFCRQNSSSTTMDYRFYNITTSSYIGVLGSSAANTSNSDMPSIAYITPSETTQVALKMVGGGGNLVATQQMAIVEVIAGSAPSTGQSVDTLFATKTSSQTLSAVGDITFTKQSGDISFNSTSITLVAGKTYELACSVFGNTSDTTGNGFISFVDSSNTIIGNSAKVVNSNYSGATAFVSTGNLNILYSPTTNTSLKVRLTQWANGNFNITEGSLVVKQLGTSSVTEMVGATSTTDGTKGTVPKPVTGQQNAVLRGDGLWFDKAYSSASARTSDTIYTTGYALSANTVTIVTCAPVVKASNNITTSTTALAVTITKAGVYRINAQVTATNSSGANWIKALICKGGTSTILDQSAPVWISTAAAGLASNIETIATLAVGDVINCCVWSQQAGYMQGGFLVVEQLS